MCYHTIFSSEESHMLCCECPTGEKAVCCVIEPCPKAKRTVCYVSV